MFPSCNIQIVLVEPHTFARHTALTSIQSIVASTFSFLPIKLPDLHISIFAVLYRHVYLQQHLPYAVLIADVQRHKADEAVLIQQARHCCVEAPEARPGAC
eukprot:GHRQ01033951.1.p2 GENE.GHRQ01033951.1~~GHRQ01033951.1.p2  ORF type:complete len:101 (+),score=7.01 GHRQ01033951.1:2-304(+)